MLLERLLSQWSLPTWRKPKWIKLFRVFLAGLLGIVLYSGLPSAAVSSPASIRFVSPNWVQEHLNDPKLRILDVRINPLEYIEGHLPKAVNLADNLFRGPNGFLPVQYWDGEKIAALFTQAGVSNDSKVVVYSDGNNILGATMVAYLLERSGATDIAVVDGGFKGYKDTQVDVTKEFPRYGKGDFRLKDNPAVRVNLSELKGLIGKPEVKIIDPRPADLYEGKVNLWVRNGHIPGAKNIPWQTFTEANNADEALKNPHQLKSLAEIRQLLADRNITPDDQIVVSCSTGREATLQYVVLKHLLGYPNVRIYEGSWTEYSATDLPIETGPDQSA